MKVVEEEQNIYIPVLFCLLQTLWAVDSSFVVINAQNEESFFLRHRSCMVCS